LALGLEAAAAVGERRGRSASAWMPVRPTTRLALITAHRRNPMAIRSRSACGRS
jgi:hypothetical protein